MASLESISNQMEAIAWRKENLRKAFEELQSHSYALSFSLHWKEIEDYFDSIQKSINENFRDLASKVHQQQEQEQKKPGVESQPSDNGDEQNPLPKKRQEPSARGVRSLIKKNLSDLPGIVKKVTEMLRSSSDPAKLGLDVMNGLDDWHGYQFLLGTLMEIAPEVKAPEKERAMKLASTWREKIETSNGCKREAVAFMRLVIAYGLASEFEVDELLEFVSIFARKKLAINLCQKLGLVENVPDFIQKLICKGMHIAAVNFVLAFELADKYPPVSLLESFLKETKKNAEELCKRGNDSIKSRVTATAKELSAMRAVIKSIEQHKLEAESLQERVTKNIVELEKQHADLKRTATTAAKKPHQQPVNKRPRPGVTAKASLRKTNKIKPQPHTVATSVQITKRFKPLLQPAAASFPQIMNIKQPTQPAATSFPQITKFRPPPQPSAPSLPQITNIRPPQPAAPLPQITNIRPTPQLAAAYLSQVTNTRSLLHHTGFLVDHVSPYLSSVGSFGFAGPSAEHAALYDRLGSTSSGPLGYGENWIPQSSHLYTSESMSSSLYSNPTGHSLASSLPPYRPPFYP